jgi:hypothetical protein
MSAHDHEPVGNHEPVDDHEQVRSHELVDHDGHEPVDHELLDHDLVDHEPVGHEPVGHEPDGHEPDGHEPNGHGAAGHDEPTRSNEPVRHRRLGLVRRRAVRYPAVISAVVVIALAVTGLALIHFNGGKATPAQTALSLTGRGDGDRVSRDLVRVDPASESPSPSPSPSSASPSPSASPSHAAPPPTHAAPPPTHAAVRTEAATPAGCGEYSGNQLIACQLLPSFGFSTSEMPALVQMWDRESGWNATAENPGSGAYGIPQALPGDKMASVAPDWQTNPATQIKWGLGYIKAQYGTPSDAWAFWQSNGWY